MKPTVYPPTLNDGKEAPGGVLRFAIPWASAAAHRELLLWIGRPVPKLQMSWVLARYLRWLELSTTEVALPMTPEVAFARHTHRVAPVDFRARGRPELDGVPVCSAQDAEQLWQQRCREPFAVEQPSRAQLRAARWSVPAAWKRLHLSLKAQRAFARKVTEPLGRIDERLWGQMLEHYSRFFALFPKAGGTELVPTLMVDFCWHTHMQNPAQYADDSERSAGRLIDHDDSISPKRVAGAQRPFLFVVPLTFLAGGYRHTRRLWFETYGTPYIWEFVLVEGQLCYQPVAAAAATSSSCGGDAGSCGTASTCVAGADGGAGGCGGSCGGAADNGGGGAADNGGGGCSGGGGGCGGGGGGCGGGGGGD